MPVSVPASKGFSILVDDCDEPLSLSHRWTASKIGSTRYAMTAIDGKTTYLHRLIMDARKGQEVDHIDGNGLNNTRDNLRIVTHKQNLANQKLSAANTSGFKGVSWNKARGAWEAHIKYDQRKRFLGNFADKADAARAYNVKAAEVFGEHARLNPV
jgi:hypothetical protein